MRSRPYTARAWRATSSDIISRELALVDCIDRNRLQVQLGERSSRRESVSRLGPRTVVGERDPLDLRATEVYPDAHSLTPSNPITRFITNLRTADVA